jgi:acetyl esterase/lipase
MNKRDMDEKEKQFQESSVRMYRNVDQHLDMYIPPNKTKKTSVMYIHGGAWNIGNKTNSKDVCEQLAREGYIVGATTYSLSSPTDEQYKILLVIQSAIFLVFALFSKNTTQLLMVLALFGIMSLLFMTLMVFSPRYEVKHPQHIEDVAQSFKWMHDNIEKYGGTKDRMIVMGHSAGGHLASLLATNRFYTDQLGLPHDAIKGCVSVSGVYNDKRLRQTILGDQILKTAFEDDEITMQDSFPIYNVSDDTPPFLLLNAGYDLNLARHTLDFYSQLNLHSVYTQTEYFEDLSHWNIMRKWDGSNKKVKSTVLGFLGELDNHFDTKKS